MLIFLSAYSTYASENISAALTRNEYWINDTVNFKIEPSFSDDIFAASFEVGYTAETLEFTGFKTDNENLFVADSFDENGKVFSGYTRKDKFSAEKANYVIFSFKVKSEGSASINLFGITTVDTLLNKTETEVNKNYTVSIADPSPSAPSFPPSDGISGGKKGSGGSVSLPKPVVTPLPEIIPDITEQKPTIPFEDITYDYWSAEYIMKLYEKNIISADKNFRPEDEISRAEFIKLVVLAFGIAPVYETVIFSDCDKSAWYNSYISAAAAAGIVQGSDGKIYPESDISRQDICVILSRITEYSALSGLNFTDSGDISDYAKDAVTKLYCAGIISGMPDGSFAPHGKATRAQAAKMICMASEVSK